MKLLALFFSFFVSLFQSNLRIQEEEKDKIEMREDSVHIDIFKDRQEIYYQNQLIKTLSTSCDVWTKEVEDTLFIFTRKENIVTMESFNQVGEKQEEVTFLNPITEAMDIIYFEGFFYLVGGVESSIDPLIQEKYQEKPYLKKTNAIILKIDSKGDIQQVDLEGGGENEYYHNIFIYQNHIYVAGYKDTLSGYDFGNGGNSSCGLVLASYNLDFTLEKYVVMDDSFFLTMNIEEDGIYFVTNEKCYLFDFDLNPKMSLKFPFSCTFSSLSNQFKLLISNGLEWKIYDLHLLCILEEGTFPEEVTLLEAKNDLYILSINQIYKINIYDLSSFQEHLYDSKILTEYNQTLEGWKKTYALTNQEISPHYDPLINGTYQIEYQYEDITLLGDLTILEEQNVRNDMVYPLGYTLQFTGTAYLNGRMIANHHRIQEEGDYTLDLYDCNQSKRTFHFTVEQGQLNFEENSQKESDFEIFPNESVFLEYEIKSTFPVQIKEIIINQHSYQEYQFENQKLKISFSNLDPGQHLFLLEEIVCEENGVLCTIFLHKWIKIQVLYDPIQLYTTFQNQKNRIEYKIDVQDTNHLSRGFLFVVGNEHYFYPMSNQKIVFSNLSLEQTYDVTCYFIADLGGKNLEELELFQMKIIPKESNFTLGEFIIEQKEENIEKIGMSINKTKSLTKIVQEDKLIYQAYEDHLWIYVLVGVLLGGLCLGFAFFLKHSKKRIRIYKKES